MAILTKDELYVLGQTLSGKGAERITQQYLAHSHRNQFVFSGPLDENEISRSWNAMPGLIEKGFMVESPDIEYGFHITKLGAAALGLKLPDRLVKVREKA